MQHCVGIPSISMHLQLVGLFWEANRGNNLRIRIQYIRDPACIPHCIPNDDCTSHVLLLFCFVAVTGAGRVHSPIAVEDDEASTMGSLLKTAAIRFKPSRSSVSSLTTQYPIDKISKQKQKHCMSLMRYCRQQRAQRAKKWMVKVKNGALQNIP